METDTPTTPRPAANRAALVCVQCGYTLDGLADSGACPECAIPVRSSIAAQRGRFPSPQRLASAHRALALLLAGTIAAPVIMLATLASFFVTPGPQAVYYAIAALGVVWVLWHSAWWRLAASDPTLAPDAPRPRSNAIVLVLSGLSLLAAAALGLLLISRLLPRLGGVSSQIMTRTVIYIVPMLLGAAQVWAGSRLLARYEAPRTKRRVAQRPDLPALRRSALLMLVLTAAMTAVSSAAFVNAAAPTPPGATLPLPLAVYSVASTYLFFGMVLSSLVTAVNLLIALLAARARTRDALRDRRLLAAIAREPVRRPIP